jgi:hypothetical protein
MMPWYRTPTLQMVSAEMEWLQSQDAATCAVLEWFKGDCVQRETNKIRDLPEWEQMVIAKRLGIDSPRFSQILLRLRETGFIVDNSIKDLPASPSKRTPEEDALRKQIEYWKKRAESVSPKISQTLEVGIDDLQIFSPRVSHDSPNVDLSPETSQSLPDSPLRGEERREEENRIKKKPKSTKADLLDDVLSLVLPEKLNSDSFRKVWREWIEYRCSVKKVRNPHALFKKNLEFLEPFGLEGAIASLNQSMNGEWRGLFPPKTAYSKNGKSSDERDPVTGLKKNGGNAR